MKVVIVDSELTSVTEIQNILRKLPECEPLGFTDSITALDWCFAEEPDLMIVGYTMPQMNGTVVVEKLLARTPDMPVLMMMDTRDADSHLLALQSGVTDFLCKPFDHVELLTRAKNMLALRKSRKELAKRTTWLVEEVREAYDSIGLNATLQNRQQAILKGANYCIIATDPNGLITDFNRAAEQMLGYRADEMIGKQTPVIIHDTTEIVAHAEKLSKESGRLITPGFEVFLGKSKLGIPEESEWTYIRKNGTRFSALLSVTAMFNDDETVAGYLFIASDITDRKQKEVELRRFKSIIDSTDDAIISMTIKGIIESWNYGAEKIFGYTANEAIGCPIQMLISPDYLNEGAEILARVSRGESVEQYETMRRHESGRLINLSITFSPILDDKGKVIGVSKVARDITDRKKAEDLQRISATAFETHEAIMITDANANILRVNQAFQDITGYSVENVLGKNPRILKSGRHDQAFYAAMWQQLLETGSWTGEIWEKRKNGQIYPKWLTINAVKDKKGATTEYVAVFNDITARKKAEEEIYSLAFYDTLTKLPNRRFLMDRIQQAQTASARSKLYGALLFLDMDKFKTLNDTLGHDHGDLFLIEIAKRLQYCVREIDTVARIGGDEFVVLIEEVGLNVEAASQKVAMIAEKIRSSLSAPYQLKEHEHHSSPSIGVSLYRGNEESLETLLKQADMAMYQVKETGRNGVRFFDPAMQLAVEAHAALEAELRKAIQKNQLRLYYQIQIRSDLQQLGAEALIRWVHPVLGMISPIQFIPIAEESSLILDIGHWVLETACKQLALWSKSKQTNKLVLAVNVSAQQFKRHDFVDVVTTLVNNHQVDPNLLKLELTESVVLSDVSIVITKMHTLRALGIKFSLDDFGTGYSSLSYLKQLPLDQIKIDQSFVRDMTTNPNDAIMVQTIINLAHNFRMNVIAEGVETDTQLNFLKLNGCMAYQGYLFSKPVPIEEYEALLK